MTSTARLWCLHQLRRHHRLLRRFHVPTLYHIPNYRYTGRRLYTNRPPFGAMRVHGVLQPRFAFESLLDELAEKIDMDPIDLRMANAMDPNTRPVIHGE